MQTKWSAHHAHSGTPVAGRQRYRLFVLWRKVGRGKDGERLGGRGPVEVDVAEPEGEARAAGAAYRR